MGNAPDNFFAVSVVVPFHNNGQTIEKTLDSLLNQRGIDEAELIAVDDHSTDKTCRLIEGHPISKRWKVKIIDNVAGGLANAYNIGAQAARFEPIVIMHADCYATADSALKDMLGLLARRGVVAVRPLVLLPRDVWSAMSFWDKVAKARYVGAERHGFGGKFDGIRRSALLELGGFDAKRFYSAGEDVDIYIRIRRRYKILDSQIRVVHRHVFPKSSRLWSILRKQAQLGQSFGAVLRKHWRELFSNRSLARLTLIHAAKALLLLGVFVPVINRYALPLLLAYAVLYSWRIFLLPDPRIVIVPFVNIIQFAFFCVYALMGILAGRQTFDYKSKTNTKTEEG